MHVYLLEMPRTEGPSSFYIGQRSVSPEESTDYWGSGAFCLNYMKGKGREFVRKNVKKTILLRDLPNQDALNYWEMFAIQDYRDRFGDRVVNWTKGGEGRAGPHTEEVKVKIGEAVKERWKRGGYKAKMAQEMKERWDSPEYKARVSKAFKEVWESPEYKAKMSKMLSETRKGENNPNYKVNSVRQILKRILASESVDIKIKTFHRALKNPNHRNHAKYMELFNKYKLEEK